MAETINYSIYDKKYKEIYFKLVETIYSDYKGLEFYLASLKRFLDNENPFFKNNDIFNFLLIEKNKPLGHISAIIDKRLYEKKIGIIGFFECINNKLIFKKLISIALKKLKEEGCKIIVGPINLSIWHSYRITIDQDPTSPFYFEPLSMKYYSNFFEEEFDVEEEYYSAERTNFTSLIEMTEKYYKKIIEEGYIIRTIDLNNIERELLLIYNLSKEIFRESKYFIDISWEEFKFIYESLKNNFFSDFIEIVLDSKNNEVGFCFGLPNPLNKKTFIIKTIGVKEKERKKGIGSALLYSQHIKAKKLGFEKAIYALIRKNNIIERLPYPDARIIRNYKIYSKRL